MEGALGDYRDALRTVERLKAELAEHEKSSRPAYGLWYNATFGATLTRIRETTAAILSQDRMLF